MYLKSIIVVLMLVISNSVAAQSNEACLKYASYREASGESLEGIKAVLQVIRNRMRIDRMNACQVVAKFGQFPWFNSSVNWKVPKHFLTKYKEADMLESQVPDNAYYFNSQKFKTFGVFYSKIGGHFFYLLDGAQSGIAASANENRVHKGDV